MHEKVKELKDIKDKLDLSMYRISIDTGINQSTLRTFFLGLNQPKIGIYFEIEQYLKAKL